MDDAAYRLRLDETYLRIERAFEDVDLARAEAERVGDVLTLAFAGGPRCLITPQRPVHQIWVACHDEARHFSFDEATGRWLDERDRAQELLGYVRDLARRFGGLDLTI